MFLPCSIISIRKIFGLHPNHDLSPDLLAHLPVRNTSSIVLVEFVLRAHFGFHSGGARVNPIDPPLGYCVNPFPVISCVCVYIYIYVYVSMDIMCLEFISFVAELSIQHPIFLDCQEICCVIPPFTGRVQPMTLPMTSPK